MVLRELRTNTLEDICTYEQLELLNLVGSAISRNQSLCLPSQNYCLWRPVFGEELSVLGYFWGFLSYQSSLCNWFTAELVLRKHPQASFRVSIAAHQSRIEMEQQCLSSFCQELDRFGDLPN